MSANSYINHLGNKDFLRVFYIKLEIRLKNILILQELIDKKKFVYEDDKKNIVSQYYTLKSYLNNEMYLIESVDYSIENTKIIITTFGLKKLYLTFISETIQSIYLFTNMLGEDNFLTIYYDYFNDIVKSLNEMSLYNNKENLINCLKVLKELKNDI